jgi:hypothetical protein
MHPIALSDLMQLHLFAKVAFTLSTEAIKVLLKQGKFNLDFEFKSGKMNMIKT